MRPTSTAVLVGGLLAKVVLLPASALAQQAALPQWFPFQVDAQLALQVPAPLRQVQGTLDQPMQAYTAQTSQATLLLIRNELPATVSIPEDHVLYTSLAQRLLTSSQAVGVQQRAFQLDSAQGLAVEFRLTKPQPGQPATGTMWLLRLQHTVYVAQWLAQPSPTALNNSLLPLGGIRAFPLPALRRPNWPTSMWGSFVMRRTV